MGLEFGDFDIYMYIYIYIYYIYMHLLTTAQQRNTKKVIFYAEVDRFEFRVFLLLNWLPYHGRRVQCPLLLTHNHSENSWIHSFPKCISAT